MVSVGFQSYNLPLVASVTPPRLRSQAFAYFVFFFGLGAIVIAGYASGIAEDSGYRQGVTILAVFEALAGFDLHVARQVRHEGRRDRRHRAGHRVAASTPRSPPARQRRHPHLPRPRGRLRPGAGALRGRPRRVHRGECVALLGTNGAGKSTVLNAISGIVDPIGGVVFFDGKDITHLPTANTAELGIVVVPGGKAVFPTLTVAEHLRAAAWLFRERHGPGARPRPKRSTRPSPGCESDIDQPAGNLSGGEQQMLALGMAFIAEPKLLIIDELSLGLAPTIVEQLLVIVRQIQATGTAIVLVEQSINVALTVADRAYFLEKGEVRFEGPTDRAAPPRRHRPLGVPRRRHRHQAAGGRRRSVAPRRRSGAHRAAGRHPGGPRARPVTKRFGGITAVDDTSLHVARGRDPRPHRRQRRRQDHHLRPHLRVPHPRGGPHPLDGIDITELRPDQRAWLGLGRSFQDARLVPSLTVAENLAISVERHLDDPRPPGAVPRPARPARDREADRLDGAGPHRADEPGRLPRQVRPRAVHRFASGGRPGHVHRPRPQGAAARRARRRHRPEGGRGARPAAGTHPDARPAVP